MKNKAAVTLGRLGGKSKSLKKQHSSKRNGALGGRPASRGVENWVRFFDAVDQCRRTRQFEALQKIHDSSRRIREKALLKSTAQALAFENQLATPSWAKKTTPLKAPYFVAGVESLKASALIESPVEFRMNNIFVLNNFLSRV